MIPLFEGLPFYVYAGWEEVVPVLDDGTGPVEPCGDYVEVWAPHQARVEALRIMRANPDQYRWPKQAAYDDRHPLDMKVGTLVCDHGGFIGNCKDCEHEWDEAHTCPHGVIDNYCAQCVSAQGGVPV